MKKVKLPRKLKKKYIKLYGAKDYLLSKLFGEVQGGKKFFKWKHIRKIINLNGGYDCYASDIAVDLYKGEITRQEYNKKLEYFFSWYM
jgi:hypothetical protein